MARVSKYDKLVGQVVDGVMIKDCKHIMKTSKSGKTYKVTKLFVTADGKHVLEIGTPSFKKMSFLKRLAKITIKWIYKAKEIKDKTKDKIQDLIHKGKWQAMMLAKDSDELAHIYRQLQDTVTDEKRFQELEHKYEVILKQLQPKMYYPAVINEKPISADIIAKHVNTLENTLYYKEFKMLFNKLAGIYHPDKGGNPKLFQEIHAIYKLQAPVLKRCKKLEQEAQDGKIAKDDYEALMQGIIKAEKSKQDWYNFRARYGC